MNQPQWRVLYRQFLFRVFDLEILSAQAQGDSSKLLGQFAGLLIWFSTGLTLAALLSLGSGPPPNNPSAPALLFVMIAQHFLIATTMLVVGLFAVLSWDATFPDRRDVLVLAKVAGVATSLGLTIALLHGALGVFAPLAFANLAAPATLSALTTSPTP